MADLISKLNVLVKASLQGVLGDDPDRAGRRSVPPLGKDIDREIIALRQQIESAFDHEDQIKAQIDALQREAADWDRQADEALARGDEATARYAIRQQQTKQQQTTLLEADLAQHRISASELIHRVNELEGVVAEARRQQQTTAPETDETPEHSLSARLRHVREIFQTQEAAATTQDDVPQVDDQAVEDDLAQRRARLSQ
jgi:phage shock protein A